MLRWRRRQHAQRTESTPRVPPSGAASQLDPSRQPAGSWTPYEPKFGGGGGIRTHGRVAPTRHFQCRTFGHSATPPSLLAEGRGFEPPRDLRPYPISSRTPSTGLGHPSAPTLSNIYRVSHL